MYHTTVLFILGACDLASGWSLAIEPHVFYWSLAGLLAILFYCIFFISAFMGNCASDWSLATGSNADVLVACMVACAESGVSWKSLVLEESIQLHQAT